MKSISIIFYLVGFIVGSTAAVCKNLNGKTALDALWESSKVNYDIETAYLLIHSEVQGLQFDSNRKIENQREISSSEWELWFPPGSHILKIDADGYQRLELPPMNFGKSGVMK